MLPEEVKGKYDKGGRDLGYYRSTRESFRERYDVGLKPCHLDELPEEEIPGIKAAVSDFKESMRNISRFVLRVVGNNLELKKNELIEAHTGALLEEENVSTKAHFSSIYYKPIPKAADDAVTVSETPEFLMQRHTDFSCITLLFATGPGLQVEVKENSLSLKSIRIENKESGFMNPYRLMVPGTTLIQWQVEYSSMLEICLKSGQESATVQL